MARSGTTLLGYWIDLSDDDVRALCDGGAKASVLVPDPNVAVVLAAVVGALAAVDSLGGNHGVGINGIWLSPFTPIIRPINY
jgi:hypothetical protein